MNWTVLGIEPTKDKDAIKRAYRARIVNTNPEDKPEEFKALRAAYEQAMELAGQEEVPQAEQTPVERWAERVRALYEDYPRRIDPACWQELLADDLCVALDTRGEVENALLRFFMERYDIPQSVWQCLDEAFSFQERQQELYENYPRDFVDYVVLNGIRYRENLPVKMFAPGKNGADCDAYLHLYNKAARMPYEEAAPLLAEMAALSEQHPYGQALACRAAIAGGEEARLEELKGLSEAYPDNHFLAMELAEQLGDAEIVSADAYQVYRELPILTAAPSAGERARVPHHLVGFMGVEENNDAALHARRALEAIRDIAARGRRAIVTGGSGLYVKFISHGISPAPPSDPALRADERLDGILKGFLQALRPSKPNLTVGSVAQPVKDCLATLKAQFEERRIRVGLNLPGALPPVAIDKDQIQQVLFNLIKNALEAMKDGGALELDIGSDDNDIILKITDDGLGMAPEQVAHLFEPYRTTKSHGTGLGLMITARIIHDHGGTIDVESQVGEGTTFTVRLPRLERRTRALN